MSWWERLLGRDHDDVARTERLDELEVAAEQSADAARDVATKLKRSRIMDDYERAEMQRKQGKA